jgi:hypothetical protein
LFNYLKLKKTVEVCEVCACRTLFKDNPLLAARVQLRIVWTAKCTCHLVCIMRAVERVHVEISQSVCDTVQLAYIVLVY